MRIISLSYKDTNTTWSIDNIRFKSLTLLVGASGVGKTQILKTILKLRGITRGESSPGANWTIHFDDINGVNYKWSGEFETKDLNFLFHTDEEGDGNTKIKFEKLYIDDLLVIDRDSEKILFNGQKTVKLPQNKSVISLLKEEDKINPAYAAFQRIIFSDQVESKFKSQNFNTEFLNNDLILNKYKDISSIREAEETFITKLYLTYKNAPDVFEDIKERYIDIFPFVQDLRIEPIAYRERNRIPAFIKEVPFIQIKERNVSDWIIQPMISSGMYRSLIHLCEIFLCSNGSLILVDEFENSLGVNCIDELTMDLKLSIDRNLQFIITSHHPYIINHIHYDNWKLITRDGSKVIAQDVVDMIDFAASKQEAFVQLTQLTEFTTGIVE